jgi:hypothetical protein
MYLYKSFLHDCYQIIMVWFNQCNMQEVKTTQLSLD